jgi:hypothetical protein
MLCFQCATLEPSLVSLQHFVDAMRLLIRSQ